MEQYSPSQLFASLKIVRFASQYGLTEEQLRPSPLALTEPNKVTLVTKILEKAEKMPQSRDPAPIMGAWLDLLNPHDQYSHAYLRYEKDLPHPANTPTESELLDILSGQQAWKSYQILRFAQDHELDREHLPHNLYETNITRAKLITKILKATQKMPKINPKHKKTTQTHQVVKAWLTFLQESKLYLGDKKFSMPTMSEDELISLLSNQLFLKFQGRLTSPDYFMPDDRDTKDRANAYFKGGFRG